ncbi:hypothetical protein D3C77_526310 [compost metagenome]
MPMTIMAPNEDLHPKCCPMNVPIGTPIILAIVSPAIIIDTALARLSGATRLEAMTAPTPKNVPWHNAVSSLAAIRIL